MTDPASSSRDFVLLGNLPCLDLVNTRPLRHGEPEELLPTFGDLVAWLEAAGVITAPRGRTALRKWDGTPEGGKILRRATGLRQELKELVERMAGGSTAGPAVVRSINAILKNRPRYDELVLHDRQWIIAQRALSDEAIHLLVPVAESAAWLIEHGERDLLRKCEDPACVLYFYDTTRNKRRRWCSMDGCGSRAKAAAYYQRMRGQ